MLASLNGSLLLFDDDARVGSWLNGAVATVQDTQRIIIMNLISCKLQTPIWHVCGAGVTSQVDGVLRAQISVAMGKVWEDGGFSSFDHSLYYEITQSLIEPLSRH